MKVIIFGFGYSASRFVARRPRDFEATGTVTTAGKARLTSAPGLDLRVFSPEACDDTLGEAIGRAEAAIVSIAPDAAGDPTLRRFGEDLAHSPSLSKVIYLSTIGVYGDHAGAWIDETASCQPLNSRSAFRLEAENAWRTFGAATGKSVHILRLAGIYGPGRNALVNLREGRARRIVKAGQVFNRIHVDDIAATIDACLIYGGSERIWNVSDDEPAPAEDVVAFAASLLGVALPPQIAFETAGLSDMARGFYLETKRVRNSAMKEPLGVRLAFPTYREGVTALFHAGEGRAAAERAGA